MSSTFGKIRLAGALSALALAIAAMPAAGRAETTLRFIPQADLRSLDPIWTTAYITAITATWSTTRCSRSTRT